MKYRDVSGELKELTRRSVGWSIVFIAIALAYGLLMVLFVYYGGHWVHAAFPTLPWKLVVVGLGVGPLAGVGPFLWWVARKLSAKGF